MFTTLPEDVYYSIYKIYFDTHVLIFIPFVKQNSWMWKCSDKKKTLVPKEALSNWDILITTHGQEFMYPLSILFVHVTYHQKRADYVYTKVMHTLNKLYHHTSNIFPVLQSSSIRHSRIIDRTSSDVVHIKLFSLVCIAKLLYNARFDFLYSSLAVFFVSDNIV